MTLFHAPEPTDAGDNLVRVSSEALIALRGAGEKLSLKTLRIKAQQSGGYLSRFKGRGMEFDEARLYQPGDDVRNVDWRVTARSGTLHTKLFREERERAVLAWVDMRPTMFFATRGAFKSVIAARAAALIAWSANRQGDRLGGLVFTADVHHELRPKRGKSAVLNLLRQLSQTSRWQSRYNETEPDADKALARLRRVAKPGSLIFLLSDFRKLGAQAESHLAQLARHNDVVLFHIYDPLEAELPRHGIYRVAWGERSSRFSGDDKTTQRQHREHFREHSAMLKQLCRFPGIHYLSCATDADLVATLQYGGRP
ncbi:hypothetical protein Tel_05910 [Candidatus Tenderia electrophaga]|jgi:uncharacterized protein (DUF58 family)|uniref:DUF58 domain-containing protein n=1 Tax=Candidatus Tenderia electrophaga TaxID=1748243 RepID=A0A0S2TC89_9GAMM|nr:hypothetical protein Tel_05910 [Candidatus Tenderia electrophaga]